MVLRTPEDVIGRLGGVMKVAELFGFRHGAVTNWLARGYFPATTYPMIRDALAKQGLKADEELWGWHRVDKAS
jgi:hypothetical protein